MFKCIFLNENGWISLKFVPKGPINNIPALVQLMNWRWPGNKTLSEPMMVSLLMYICVTRPQRVKHSLVLICSGLVSHTCLKPLSIHPKFSRNGAIYILPFSFAVCHILLPYHNETLLILISVISLIIRVTYFLKVFGFHHRILQSVSVKQTWRERVS